MSPTARRWLHRLLGVLAASGLLAGLVAGQHQWIRIAVLLSLPAAAMGMASIGTLKGSRAPWLLAHLTLITFGAMMALAVPSLQELGGPDLRWITLGLIGLAVACGIRLAHGGKSARANDAEPD